MGSSLADLSAGRQWNKRHLSAVMDSLNPVGLSSIPPVANAAIAYYGNYDLWRGEKVSFDKDMVSPSKEFTASTRRSAIKLSKMMADIGIEVSPERMATAGSKIIPTSNPISTAILDMTVDAPIAGAEGQTVVEDMKRTPFVNRFLRFTGPINPSAEQLTRARNLGVKTESKSRVDLQEEIDTLSRSKADVIKEQKYLLDYEVLKGGLTPVQAKLWVQGNIKDMEIRNKLNQYIDAKARRR